MKIKKTVDEKGNITVEIQIDGEWEDSPDYSLSRKLTGTTSEQSDGIFCQYPSVNFTFGNYKYQFEFDNRPDSDYSAEKIAEILENRIQRVKKWVAECRGLARIETAEILTVDEVIEHLQDKNRLYYRNNKGQIKALDI